MYHGNDVDKVVERLSFSKTDKSKFEDTTMKIEMESIGYVRNKVKDRKDVSWGEDTSSIILDEEYNFGF